MPGGNFCSVAFCKSSSEKAKKGGEHLRFFTFPKDDCFKKEWIRKCSIKRGKNVFDPRFKRICSKHFTLNDYEDALQAQLMFIHPKKLKKTAIPSLNLNQEGEEETDFEIEVRNIESERIGGEPEEEEFNETDRFMNSSEEIIIIQFTDDCETEPEIASISKSDHCYVLEEGLYDESCSSL